jgi:Transposase domain (DUF772).
MITRKEKREAEKGNNYFFEFIKIQNHFFKALPSKFKNINDPRTKAYITYEPEVLLFTLIMKQATGLESMRQMTAVFNTEEAIHNMSKFLGIELEDLPHYDTINNFLEKLDTTELESIRTYMIKELIKKRCLEAYRITENEKMGKKYWAVIIDGTGLHTFHEKHCEHCLKREYKDKETGEVISTVYMHHVLEAKLVIGEMVFSIASEFIENESETVKKQDCELKAFYRLAAKIKSDFPRLPICILGDSIYACESIFKECDKYKWKFLCRFKEGRIPTIAKEFEDCKQLEIGNVKKIEVPNEQTGTLYWINEIGYKKRTVNLLELELETPEGKKTQNYVFITNFRVTKNNVKALVASGRSRWKIENQGFNYQKTKQYHIEHLNSHNYKAMKNHYLLVQITDVLLQLYRNGLKILKKVKKTAKEKSSNLLETFRRQTLTNEDLETLEKPIQVRLF